LKLLFYLRADVDVLKLVRADRFCVKYCQQFDRSINSNFAHLMLNIVPIQLEIDYRKLLMLGLLCRLPSDSLAKQVFVNRLTRFFMLDRQFKGFIPDIYSKVRKYGLEEYLDYICISAWLVVSRLNETGNVHLNGQYTIAGITTHSKSWKESLLRMILEDLSPLKTVQLCGKQLFRTRNLR